MLKIAFASTDNIFVDQHFGWSEKFYIYEIQDDSFIFVKEVDSSLKKDDEIEKLIYKIESLEDAKILYVLQIGPKASTMVQSAGIFPMKSSKENEKIEDVLNSLIRLKNDNPPIWMRRLFS
jgi:nitrogen fixation protein NifX